MSPWINPMRCKDLGSEHCSFCHQDADTGRAELMMLEYEKDGEITRGMVCCLVWLEVVRKQEAG